MHTQHCSYWWFAAEVPHHSYMQWWPNMHCILPVWWENITFIVNNISKLKKKKKKITQFSISFMVSSQATRHSYPGQSYDYMYSSWWHHWHWGNHMIAPVSMMPPWRIHVNKFPQSIEDDNITKSTKTKHNKVVCIFHGHTILVCFYKILS